MLCLSSTVLAAISLAKTAVAGIPPICPYNATPLSCHNTTTVENTCCFETGGQVLQVQFWDTNPATGPANHWTIHGLWPDYCDGTYTQYCDDSREYTNITQILESYNRYDILNYMNTYWKNQDGTDESFWEHEWDKHGTCYSTLVPDCYIDYTPQEEVVDFFSQTVHLFQSLPTYDFLAAANIFPSATKNYTYDEIMVALNRPRGVNATLECEGAQIYEVYYTFNIKGSIADGLFVPENPIGEGNGCPNEIQYLPKNMSNVYVPAPSKRSRKLF